MAKPKYDMTFITAWNAYKQVTRNSGLTAAAQLLGYELLVRFDMARFPESITASDRELAAALGIGFRTVGDAKRRLKNAGVIDFSAKQGRSTVFKWTLTPHSDCTVAQNSNITRTRTARTTTAATTKENSQRNRGKGRFDDEEPDYSWFYGDAGNAEPTKGTSRGKGRFDDEPEPDYSWVYDDAGNAESASEDNK